MVRIDKKMTALIIPNAIQISTLHAKVRAVRPVHLETSPADS
jgi:hypothetical protein